MPAHQQRIFGAGAQNQVRRRPREEAHIAAQRRRGLDVHAVQNLGAIHHLGVHVFLHRRGAGMLFHVAQHDLLQAGGVVQKIGFALRKLRHLLEEGAIHILPQPDRGNSDMVGYGILR